jgi:hypothetical protein
MKLTPGAQPRLMRKAYMWGKLKLGVIVICPIMLALEKLLRLQVSTFFQIVF